MKKYRVNVNGTTYEVEVEELTEIPAGAAAPAKAATPVQGEQITSPMPGNILDVRVASGVAVKAGQVLMILEAMKMENEIICPRDGKIASVNVSKGDAVETGALLCVIE